MSNRINPVDQGMLGKIGDKVGQAGSTKKAGTDSAVANTGGGQQSTTDTVELTHSAQLLEQLDKTLTEVSAVDSGRIEAVRTAIENGDYTIDADRIAEALVRFDRELGS